MKSDAYQEGGAANIKGISRNKNPYGYTKEGVEWDSGWFCQTQHYAKRPENMCKGRECTAMPREPDSEHSTECRKDHDESAHVLALVPLDAY